MRIGIDCRTILDPERGEAAGVGHYTYHLIENLLKIDTKNKYVLFFDRRVGDAGHFKQRNSEIKFFPFIEYKTFLPIAYSHFLVAAYVSRERLDVFHSPACTVPLAYSKNSVVTIHDMAIYQNKSWFPGQIFSTRIVVPQSVKKAKRVISVSNYTKQDLVKFMQIPEERVTVVYNGVDIKIDERHSAESRKDYLKNKFGVEKKYVLFVGTIQPRKNVMGVIQAFDRLRGTSAYDDFQLVISGKKGWDNDDVFRAIRQFGLTKKVIFTGYITSSDKALLMRNASLFVFPSFYEGFGLSILEAQKVGTPVITSDITSMPEVADDGAILVDPYDIDALSKAMKKALTDHELRNSLIKKGYENVKKFSWEKCARETLAVYEEVVGK